MKKNKKYDEKLISTKLGLPIWSLDALRILSACEATVLFDLWMHSDFVCDGSFDRYCIRGHKAIEADTGIPSDTSKNFLCRLVRKGFIIRGEEKVDGRYQYIIPYRRTSLDLTRLSWMSLKDEADLIYDLYMSSHSKIINLHIPDTLQDIKSFRYLTPTKSSMAFWIRYKTFAKNPDSAQRALYVLDYLIKNKKVGTKVDGYLNWLATAIVGTNISKTPEGVSSIIKRTSPKLKGAPNLFKILGIEKALVLCKDKVAEDMDDFEDEESVVADETTSVIDIDFEEFVIDFGNENDF